MFDVGLSEMVMIAFVAIVVIGPKEMPKALRTAGRWIGKMRRISGHFRSGIDAMVREAELEEMERKWREQNEAIMKAHPQLAMSDDVVPNPAIGQPASAEAGVARQDGAPDFGPASESNPDFATPSPHAVPLTLTADGARDSQIPPPPP